MKYGFVQRGHVIVDHEAQAPVKYVLKNHTQLSNTSYKYSVAEAVSLIM